MNIRNSLDKLNSLCKEYSWNSRDLANGKNYRVGGQTIISIYTAGTDTPGCIEIAFEANNIAKLYNKNVSDVRDWIKELQASIGSYARPKTRYQYPRVAVATNQQFESLVQAIRKYLENDAEEVKGKQHILSQEKSRSTVVDKRVLASILSRRGQPKFRENLLVAYNGKCAITKCETMASLEAAHIIPHAQEQTYELSRGILLRADIHTLFDLFFISINPETGTVVIAPECKPSYDEIEGTKVAFPSNPGDSPDPSVLLAHYQRWLEINGS